MEYFMDIALANRQKAHEIITSANIYKIWESVGAEVHLVGSLSMGLMMKHRDIDFHIYSSPLSLSGSFKAMAMLAENPRIKKIECANLMHTEEACIEWHALYEDTEGKIWQIDMIHIQKGSRYDGFFEKMAERISAVLTPETRETILRLKYETPDNLKVMGVEYYEAVIRYGIRTYTQFMEWRRNHPVEGIVEWMP